MAAPETRSVATGVPSAAASASGRYRAEGEPAVQASDFMKRGVLPMKPRAGRRMLAGERDD
jgi:hypothetical protein